MNPKDSLSAARAAPVAVRRNVALSPWVNERFPAWEELLSAHDVARLTRRPRWVLLGLVVLGQFPPKQRFHVRGIGWLRDDVLTWVSQQARPTVRARAGRSSATHRCTETASCSCRLAIYID